MIFGGPALNNNTPINYWVIHDEKWMIFLCWERKSLIDVVFDETFDINKTMTTNLLEDKCSNLQILLYKLTFELPSAYSLDVVDEDWQMIQREILKMLLYYNKKNQNV